MVAAEWLSPEQLADELHLPVKTIYAWNSRGTGPRRHTIGRHVRYKRADIDPWLEKQADEPATH